MGKSKKIKKGSKDDDKDSDVELEAPKNAKEIASKAKGKSKSKNDESSSDSEGSPIPVKPVKKTKNDAKVMDVTKELKKLEVENKKKTKKKPETDDDSESDSDESIKGKGKKTPAKKGGFSLLVMDDSSESDHSENESSEEEKPKIVPKKPPPKEQGGKKSKKAKKKKDDSDDDIDKVLAELEMEYSGKKPAAPIEKKLESVESAPLKSELPLEGEEPGAAADDVEGQEDLSTVKTAAQKKKEKKEREKLKKQAAKKQDASVKETEPLPTEKTDMTETVPVEPDVNLEPAEEDPADPAGDKKKKKKKGEKVVEEKTKKGPAKKAIAAMQETLKKIKEEEERQQREEEERLRLEDEREEQRLEALRLEKEKKDRKKKKEKERKEKLKAEGKFLTPKQKADKARALAMIESLKEQAGEGEGEGKPEERTERKPRLGTRVRPGRLKKQTSDEQRASSQDGNTVKVEIVDAELKLKSDVAKKELIKDSWDAESSSSDEAENEGEEKEVERKEMIEGSVSSDDDDTSDSDSDSGEEEIETPVEAPASVDLIDKTTIKTKKRQGELEEKIEEGGESSLRAAIVCVLGHVDTGKTKILDKLRRTNVQDGEAGGITQQIGATNVPIENIKEQTRHVKGVNQIEFKIPGLLIIDTPGHESFSNLRSRGSSLCDIAILVVDIMHGLEPQTLESINLLKARKTPFIVALNKMDRLYDWQSAQRKDVKDIIKSQHTNTQNEFDTRTKEVIVQFAEQGLNAALYYENPDVRTYVSLVPTSAVTGEGMGNLLALIIQSCEGMLRKRLLFSRKLQATVLEVKAIPGLGTTIDAILINGSLREGDTMVLAGTDGPIVTQIRSLLMPQPMKELRVKNAYIEHKEVIAAQGVKIAAKDLEKAVAGLNLLVARKPDEVDVLREEVAKDLKTALSGIKLSDRGVYVQASTLGSLEALLEFLKSSKIPYSAIRIGPVVKRDVMKASAMLEHESQYAVILAFDVKVERDAQEMADNLGVTIFQADIIYHLFDKFMAHRDQLKQRKREEFKHIAVFPCKLKILPQFVFNSRDPIIIGVIVEAGIVKEGTPICVPSKEFVEIGIVTSIESNHKQVETARKGMEVCIKIDPMPGDAPKMFGRHFDDTDFLVSKISRASIDACKDYFRDDLVKTDWQLMVELKNLFQIL